MRALILMARKDGDEPVEAPLHAITDDDMNSKLADTTGTTTRVNMRIGVWAGLTIA